MAGFENYEPLMANLGKYKTGKFCLYIKRLEDMERHTLREQIRQSVAHMTESNGQQ